MNQLKAGAFLSYVVIAVNILIGLVYTPYMLRMLGQAEYGIYSLAASVIAYLTVLDLGFGNAIVRYTAKFIAEGKREEQYKMFGMFLKLYTGIGAVALLIGLGLYFNVDRMFSDTMNSEQLDTMRMIMMLMSFNLAVTFPLSIFGSIITAYENFVFQKVVNIVRILLNPLVMVVLLALGYKAVAMVVVTTLFNLATLSINAFYCFNKLKIRFTFGSFDTKFLKEVSIYSLWIFFNAIMDRIYWSTGQFILGIYRGAESVAIYAVAIQLKTMFFMFSTAISGVFLPKVTAMITKGCSNEQMSDLFIRTGRIQYAVMSLILSGFIIFGTPFIRLWAGEGYDEAYTITLLLFIPSLIPLIQNLGITILQAQNRMKFRSVLYLVISVSSVFLAIPLAQMYGGIGCAIATSAALTLGQGIVMNIYYQRNIKINIIRFWGEIIKMSIVPAIVVLLSHFAMEYYFTVDSFYSLLGLIALFGVVYLIPFWLLSLNKSERDLVLVPLKKIGKK